MPDSTGRQFTTLVVLALAATLSPVSIDMLTPSLPGLSADLGTSAQTIELTLYSFLIGYGIAPSLWGAMSDRVGRRPVMLLGMIIYSISSLAGAVIDDANWLIAMRFVQGIGGAAGATMARAIVRDLYGASGTTRGMARMMSLMAVVPFFMPLLGGLLASLLSWKACFTFMSLIGIVSVGTYLWLVPESLPPRGDQARKTHKPIVSILTNRIFAQHTVCNMFCIAILVLFGANFSFITGHHFQFGSTANGLVLALFNGSIAAGMRTVWWLMPRFGEHHSILIGAGSSATGWLVIALLAYSGHASPMLLAPLLAFSAAGCGVIIALCSGAALTPFAHNAGTASSLYLLLQSTGASGISLVVGLVLPKQLLPIAVAIAACACMAVLSKILLSHPRSGHGSEDIM